MKKVIWSAAAGLGFFVRLVLWLIPVLFILAGVYLFFEALSGYDERLAALIGGAAFIVVGFQMRRDQ